MKCRLYSAFLSFAILLSLVSFSTIPAFAAADHTYYSQKGWKYNGKELDSLCYATCIAMSLSDLGKSVTPLDIYINNGYTANCKDNTATAKDYGVSWGRIVEWDVLKSLSATEKEAIIKQSLETGNYPQGIMLYGGGHMVLARKVVNGTVYFDDPVNGCCIPIERCDKIKYSNITLIACFSAKGANGSNSNGNNGGTTLPSVPTVTSTENGNWTITIPANYKLLLYAGNTSTSSTTYISARSSSYTINCSQRATLSNGAVRYYAGFNESDHYWFAYTSGMSSVQNNVATTIHTINFNANGGSVSTNYKQVKAGETYGDLPTPTRSGYIFDGWYTAASGGTKVTSTTTVNLSSDQITLYAHWSPSTLTVTFNANGGSVSLTQKTISVGSSYGELPTPSNGDLYFDGWYTAPSGGTKVKDSSLPIANTDHTLYAHWLDIYHATLDPNGGTVQGSTSPIRVEYYSWGYSTFPTATRAGYTFDGWYTEKNGGTKQVSGTWTNYGENAYFYAHWTPIEEGNYVVTFDSLGGEQIDSIEVQKGGTYGKLPTSFGPKFGFSFLGWFTEPTGGVRVKEGDPLVVNADHTLYAHYDRILYIITFDPNGGKVNRELSEEMSQYPQQYYAGAKADGYGDLPKAAREGYTFLGWFTAPVGGTQVVKGMSYIVQDDHTLYAHWR